MQRGDQSVEMLRTEVDYLEDQIRLLEERIKSNEMLTSTDSQKLLNIIQGSNLGSWEWNIKTGKTIFNERWAEIIGYSLEELEPTTIETWVKFAHPEDLNKSNIALERHFRGETPYYDVEVRIRHKSGHWVWVRDRGKVMDWAEDGSPLWMYGSHTDISKQVEMQFQLKKLLDQEINLRDAAVKERDNQETLTDMLFDQPMTDVFYMMLDEPIHWNDQQDKAALINYAFEHHRITRVNKTMLDQYRAKEEDLIGATPKDMFAHDPEHGKAVWRKFFDEGHLHIETNEQRMDGSTMLVLGDYICIYDEMGRIVGHFGVQTDVTEKVQAEENERIYREALNLTENRYQTIVENISDVIWIINQTKKRLTYVSPSVANLLGYSVEEAMEKGLERIIVRNLISEDLKVLLKSIEGISESEKLQQLDSWQTSFSRKDGTTIWIENSAKLRYNQENELEVVGVSRDITKRKKDEEELIYLSHHDLQTGLLNRAAVKKMIIDSERNNELIDYYSAIYMDLDNFKLINEALGHEGADRIIKNVAERIENTIKNNGEIYHYGNDEFLILVKTKDMQKLKTISNDFQKMISRQITIINRILFVTVSIGICQAKTGTPLDEVIINAQRALYEAKKYRNTVIVYKDTLDDRMIRDFILEKDLSMALEGGQFELFYQPIFDVRSGEFNQAEALLRWNHPEFGRVSPVEFIPIAEKTRLIIPMTDWVIEQACRRISEWKRLGFGPMVVSVNISLMSIENRGDTLVTYIRDTIHQNDICASSLKLEITESTLINDLEEVIRVFKDLKAIGVKLALDDFGTGYSTFGNLIELPLDIIKLDRALIRNLENCERARMIVSSMITIIHGLNLEVVVEGVETQAQFRFLKGLNSDYIQGFIFSQPLPESEFVKYYFSNKMPESQVLPDFRYIEAERGYIEWKEDWDSEHHEIDRQHFSIMQLSNQILRFVVNGKGKKEIMTQVDILIEYTKAHFEYEDALNTLLEIPEAAQHADEHERLIKKAYDLKTEYQQGNVKPSVFFIFIIDDFILGHLIEEDSKHFAAYKDAYEQHFRTEEDEVVVFLPGV